MSYCFLSITWNGHTSSCTMVLAAHGTSVAHQTIYSQTFTGVSLSRLPGFQGLIDII